MSKVIKFGGGFLLLVICLAAVFWLIDTLGYVFGGIAALVGVGFIAKCVEAFREASADLAQLEFYSDIRQIKALPHPSFGAFYNFDLECVGESGYQRAMNRLLPAETKGVDSFRVYAKVKMRPEPSNVHDKNAVAILLAGSTVAYMARDDAKRYRSRYGEASFYVWAVIAGGIGKISGIWLDVSDEQLS